jgi:Uma2 family endonuclease
MDGAGGGVGMSVAAERFYTEEEYLELERAALTKSEYVDGYIYAMAGGTDAHDTISVNLYASLHSRLQGVLFEHARQGNSYQDKYLS